MRLLLVLDDDLQGLIMTFLECPDVWLHTPSTHSCVLNSDAAFAHGIE